MNHILKTNLTETTGFSVLSVEFSYEVRFAVVITCKGLLGELNPEEHKNFALIYNKIKQTLYVFNNNSTINDWHIRNAIRVLDMRIQHCKNSLKKGEWKELSDSYSPFVSNIIEEKLYKNYRKVEENTIFHTQYIGTTMEIMLTTRQILVDSLITISSEFE